MVEVVLKRTRKEPTRTVSLDDFKVYKKYLYTDTGIAGRWSIAMYVVYPENEIPPKELRFKMEAIENDG